jgi:hypothetical protein
LADLASIYVNLALCQPAQAAKHVDDCRIDLDRHGHQASPHPLPVPCLAHEPPFALPLRPLIR